MTRWRTLLPWAAPAWLLLNILIVLFIDATIYDWPCGPPNKTTCDIARDHPVFTFYIRASGVGMLILVAAAAVLAVRRDLTRRGWIGFGVSLVLALAVAWLTFGT